MCEVAYRSGGEHTGMNCNRTGGAAAAACLLLPAPSGEHTWQLVCVGEPETLQQSVNQRSAAPLSDFNCCIMSTATVQMVSNLAQCFWRVLGLHREDSNDRGGSGPAPWHHQLVRGENEQSVQ